VSTSARACCSQPGAGARCFCGAARRFGEHTERDAFNREARHFVAQPELAVKAVREMKHEAAAECRRLFQHRRMQPRARLPLGVDVDNQAGRASSTDHVRVRLSAAPEQQGRRTVSLRVVAANLGDAPARTSTNRACGWT
jgi:hypothetical protein